MTTNINSPVRRIGAKVELYNGSTLAQTFTNNDSIKSISVDRVGESSKFFGYGICQKANIKLIDVNREKSITTQNAFKIYFNEINNFPDFYVSQVSRDENTNELSVTAYDALYKAANHTVAEMNLTSYTIEEFAEACAALLNLSLKIVNVTDNSFATAYETGANFEGTETLRDALNAVAEATQTIYFVNSAGELIFKRLDREGEQVLVIDRDSYFTLSSSDNRRLSTITHATELGDNVSVSMTATGTTQFVRDNPFWDLRDDIADLLDSALISIGGLTINQFECSWRGNYTLEIGDKISLITKDKNAVVSYLLDDVINYDGTYSQRSQWHYEADEAETASNPTSLGETLKQTYARVDKANKEIEILVSEVDANTENISQLFLDTGSINATVTQTQQTVEENLAGINESISTLTNRVNATMTAEEIEFTISSALDNGVTKVETSTGFKFDDEGLSISKSTSELNTKITENGMTIYRNDEEVLVADNVGVNAANLHATTYLIIGTYSRFEDYVRNGEERTGCFWLGS